MPPVVERHNSSRLYQRPHEARIQHILRREAEALIEVGEPAVPEDK